MADYLHDADLADPQINLGSALLKGSPKRLYAQELENENNYYTYYPTFPSENDGYIQHIRFSELEEDKIYRYIVEIPDGYEYSYEDFADFMSKNDVIEPEMNNYLIYANNYNEPFVFELSSLSPNSFIYPANHHLELYDVEGKKIWYLCNIFYTNGNLYVDFVNKFYSDFDSLSATFYDL